MPEYAVSGPLDCTTPINSAVLRGKTAIVTGGANGLGEAYVRALVAAGSLVCIADLNEKAGHALEKELSGTKFVKCDVTSWDDQVKVFEAAASMSSTGKIAYVVANAGMIKADTVYGSPELAKASKPQKPDLQIINVNIVGTMYTITLAQHYFMKQNGIIPSSTQEDSCLVLIGSGASFLDCLRAPQYQATKWAMRGVMHSLRRTAFFYGSRVNVIAPWYVRTSILSQKDFDTVAESGVELALIEDAQKCLLRILSDTSINGRSLFISARKWAREGYIDLDIDDYHSNPLLEEIQQDQIRTNPVSLGVFEE